jgi:hypothetical protein
MLDQLIIAYAAMGFGPEEAFEEAWLDYGSISHVPTLAHINVYQYGAFF